MSNASQLKDEIARLQASIHQHKTQQQFPPRSNSYVNPNYKPTSNPVSQTPPAQSGSKKDVVIGGIAFESSRRSLVRKDLPKPPPASSSSKHSARSESAPYARRSGHLVPSRRVYKPKSSRGRGRRQPGPRNMTLTNNKRPYQARLAAKRAKYSEKPCPRFTTTGSCSRGLTCLYQHDPDKIAICWNFLQGTCPNSNDSCQLSHDPTPERTPLCVHFVNKGRCTRQACPFPHVNVGPREGICRDFAVLGYCKKGLDCEHQHVRECPDFAEKGACTLRGCKLPHVIRANRNRKPVTATGEPTPALEPEDPMINGLTANDGQLGDEFISLTFNESESSEDESDEEEEGDEEEDSDSDDRDDEPLTVEA
ncbi:hypothetical protein DL96DRAFT_1583103 [Flagelloscypha sp. PMI_526]|nr:hypothetical protein DL96DRAFT_1583103 [Flagelloscypha sp. PMI_526]